MKNRSIAFLLALSLWLPATGRAQSLALSFDDGLDPTQQPQAASWNASILEALSKAGTRSILFAAGKRVDSAAGLKLVRDWGNAGHAVANHTYSHLNFGSEQTALAAFIADVQRNEALLSGLPGWTRRLRFPYLKEGETASKRDDFRGWMTAHGYKTGAVSIDASDWYYNSRYLAWLETTRMTSHRGSARPISIICGVAPSTTMRCPCACCIGASGTSCCCTPTRSMRHSCRM